MTRDGIRFLFLNLGHFLDHFFVLIFATVAALRLSVEWDMSYAQLIPYATPGFVAFGVCAIPAGWLADRWSREGMLSIFFVGIGTCAMLSAMAETPLQIGVGLTLIGVFAAIYHPVGLAMVVHNREKTGLPVAVNGVFGNLGVASAALCTGFLIDHHGWRSAFAVPGAIAVAIGLAYVVFTYRTPRLQVDAGHAAVPAPLAATGPRTLLRVFAVIFLTTALGGLIFQSTTFALPKIFDERLGTLAGTATLVGWYAFWVFALAAFAQLLVGYLIDRFSLRTVFAGIALLQAIFLGVMLNSHGAAALIVAIAFMLMVFGQIPINDVLVGRVTRSGWRARAYALRSLVTFSVMASAVPMIAWLHAGWGFNALFAVLAAAALCIFIAVLALPAGAAFIRRTPSSAA